MAVYPDQTKKSIVDQNINVFRNILVKPKDKMAYDLI